MDSLFRKRAKRNDKQAVTGSGIQAFYNRNQEPLSASLIKYIKANQTLDFNILYPSDHWQVLGGSMQKYLADQADRKTLAEEIETYWKNVK